MGAKMSKDEAMTILWNMRADYIKANECGLATKGEFSKEIEALTYVINEYYFGMNELYPLTIIKDRYNGAYSGGEYTAWNLEPEEIPTQIFYDDVSCYGFWLKNKIPVGKGNTPLEAIKNLKKLLGE